MRKRERYPSIVACRHGKSLANFLGNDPFIADNPPKNEPLLKMEDYQVPLSTTGIHEAKKLGLFLRKHFGVPDVVIDSGYIRAMQTCEFALQAGYTEKEISSMIVKTDDRFRERESGPLRKTPREAREILPYWKQDRREWMVNPYQSRSVGGESIADQVVRTRQAVLELKDLYPGKTIFIFCHGHTLHAIEIPMSGFTIDQSIAYLKNGWTENCAIHHYRGKKRGWKKVRKHDPLA